MLFLSSTLLDVSVVDLTVKLIKPATYAQICQVIKAAADGPMKGIMGYCDEDIVSTDLLGDQRSSILTARQEFNFQTLSSNLYLGKHPNIYS